MDDHIEIWATSLNLANTKDNWYRATQGVYVFNKDEQQHAARRTGHCAQVVPVLTSFVVRLHEGLLGRYLDYPLIYTDPGGVLCAPILVAYP